MKIERIDRSEAFRYMGFRGGEISDTVLRITDECEDALLKAIIPRYVYRVFDIAHNESDKEIEVINTSLIFGGNDICSHLKGCDRCIMLCVTLSGEVDKCIRAFQADGAEKALIADTLASAAVEQVCEIAEEEIRRQVGDYGYTWRFSPGYGDFPLEVQKDFLDVLEAPKRIGVNITDSLILIPRKSVTAVIGVSEREIPKGRRGCGSCNMRDRCEFRKSGGRCGD